MGSTSSILYLVRSISACGAPGLGSRESKSLAGESYCNFRTPCALPVPVPASVSKDRYTKRAESPTEERRNAEVVYPPAGKFCREGAVKFCPAGTYGELARLHEEDTCSDLCPAG